MPSKKKKYNARFPPARIKKIMQKDEDVGKVAAPVPVLISKALEIFVEGLITKASQETLSRNAKTLTTSHIKQCIEQENKFDFLKDLVENVPTISCEDDDSNSGSIQSDKLPNSRRRKGIRRDASAQSSVQSVDEPSSDEDSFESDESESKDERQRHPAETSNASAANSSSSSSHPPFHTVPQSYHNSFPYPGQLASGAMYPSAMPPPTMPPPPLLPPQHGALSGNTPAMGAYLAPQPQASRNNDNDEDSDEDYDA
ncbi:dr1-associated corepressor-like [Lytechinus pictus]|uniref:dr1-associated corepressor-like n=1 Tax=Lytechinus pictus TaxID=7653 RepID=UPI0030B9B3C3